MVKRYPVMTSNELLPFLNPNQLRRFSRLNKTSYRIMQNLNYQVLFEAWGITLTPDEVKETQISASKALNLAA
jgi:hypothetical protein